jgi:hypothetical protein
MPMWEEEKERCVFEWFVVLLWLLTPFLKAGPDVHLLQSLMTMWEEEKERCVFKSFVVLLWSLSPFFKAGPDALLNSQMSARLTIQVFR